jgi:hypothetical protein
MSRQTLHPICRKFTRRRRNEVPERLLGWIPWYWSQEWIDQADRRARLETPKAHTVL